MEPSPERTAAAAARTELIAVLVDTAYAILRARSPEFASKSAEQERCSPRRSGAPRRTL
jgi:hypothetical protein